MNNKVVLVTGGTGSFGRRFIKHILDTEFPSVVRVFSRDELKQAEMAEEFKEYVQQKRLRFFIGDVRDKDRVRRAMDGVQTVVHTAALKRVEVCEYNPFEAIQTNIIGTQNLIDAALEAGVGTFIALSTDKAVSPINLYGGTKLCLEKLVTAAGNYSGKRTTKFHVVRYGNVLNSRGSILHLFREQLNKESFTITDPRMTRFLITFSQAIDLVIKAYYKGMSGEILVPKLPSANIIDIATAMDPTKPQKIIGLRPGEKLHEAMIAADELMEDVGDFYVVGGPRASKSLGHSYDSGSNTKFLTIEEIKALINKKEAQ